MGVKLWVNKGHIYLSLCYGGRQWRECTGLTVSPDKTQQKEVMRVAEVMRSKRELSIVAGSANGTAEGQTALFDYVSLLAQSKQDKKVLPYLEKYGGKNIKVSDVTEQWFESFQNNMRNDPVLRSPYTQEKYTSFIRKALKKAVRENLLAAYPAEKIRHIKTPDSKRAFLTPDELHRMKNTPCPGKYGAEIHCAFLLGAYTGLRVSDIMSLRWEEVERDEMQISKKMQKTKEFIYIPINKSILDLLDSMSNEGETVFPSLSRLKDITTTNRNISQWAKRAGVTKHVTWHISRHTNATQLLEAGADLYTVQKLLGHSNITTTAKYTKVTDRKKREAVKNLTERLD